MLIYDPKDAVTTLPEGEYNAVLEKYEEKESSKGNQMAVLTWKVFVDNSNATPFVTDYIVMPMFTWKLKRLAQSLGKEDDFKNKGFQPEDYIGTSTRVHLAVQQQDGFDDKNIVKTYVVKNDREKPWVAAAKAEPKPNFAPEGSVDESKIPF